MPKKKVVKKAKDKWKLKSWYKVIAPVMFDNAAIGETLADSGEKLKGRVLETTVQTLTGDITKGYFKLYFQIDKVVGSEAYTRFIGHELASDYIRRLTRRRRAKLDVVSDVTTADNYKIRVKPLAVGGHKLKSSQELAIKKIISELLVDFAKSKKLSEFVKSIISGELAFKLFEKCKSVYPLRKVETRKSEVLGRVEVVRREPEEAVPTSVPETPLPSSETQSAEAERK